MRRRRLAALGALAGAGVLVARRRRAAGSRVDVYHEDGSMVSLDPRLPQAERMLGAARHALALARAGA